MEYFKDYVEIQLGRSFPVEQGQFMDTLLSFVETEEGNNLV